MPGQGRSGPRPAKHYALGPSEVMCLSCGEGTMQHPDGRPRLYCSERCRVRAFRERNRTQSTRPTTEG